MKGGALRASSFSGYPAQAFFIGVRRNPGKTIVVRCNPSHPSQSFFLEQDGAPGKPHIPPAALLPAISDGLVSEITAGAALAEC
jgi:hypothetical protein